MGAAAAFRYLLFGFVCVVLVAVAFLWGVGDGPPSGASSASSRADGELVVPRAAKEVVARAHRLTAGLRPAARSFLRAYFRYEVGESGAGVTAALRGSTTSAFGRELVSMPPRSSVPGSFPPVAHLGDLEVLFISPRGDRAVVNGEAKRGPAGEQFSFVFVLAGGRWLASGAGE